MFNHRGGPIPWPTQTKLSSILSKFLDGDEMQSRSFPNEWSSEFYRKKGLNRDRQGGGSHSSSGYQGRGGQGDKSYQSQGGERQGGGSYNSNGYQGRGGQGDRHHQNQGRGGGGGSRTQLPPQGGAMGRSQQDCHPKIKKMMAPYWEKFGGRVRFNQILEAADVSINDLPAMNKHVKGGRNQLCWLGALGAPRMGAGSSMKKALTWTRP